MIVVTWHITWQLYHKPIILYKGLEKIILRYISIICQPYSMLIDDV